MLYILSLGVRRPPRASTRNRGLFWGYGTAIYEIILINTAKFSFNNDFHEELGYRCLVIWQCEMRDIELLMRRMTTFLGKE